MDPPRVVDVVRLAPSPYKLVLRKPKVTPIRLKGRKYAQVQSHKGVWTVTYQNIL